MNEGKRMAGSYEVIQAIHIGDQEIVLGQDPGNREGAKFICAFCQKNSLLAQYSDILGSDDYLETVELYCLRISEQISKTREQMAVPTQQGIDDAPITTEMCRVVGRDVDINNQVIVISPDSLRPEYQRATCQLKLCMGGFGASPNSRGSAVYCTDLYTGRKTRFEREDVLGILEPEQLPDWAAKALLEIRQKQPKTREER